MGVNTAQGLAEAKFKRIEFRSLYVFQEDPVPKLRAHKSL